MALGGRGWAGLDSMFQRSRGVEQGLPGWSIGGWDGLIHRKRFHDLFPSFSVAATVPSWSVGENLQLPRPPLGGVFRPPLLSSKIH